LGDIQGAHASQYLAFREMPVTHHVAMAGIVDVVLVSLNEVLYLSFEHVLEHFLGSSTSDFVELQAKVVGLWFGPCYSVFRHGVSSCPCGLLG
jgi:hypothetical protein